MKNHISLRASPKLVNACLAAGIAVAWLSAGHAVAWDKSGHRIVAQVAFERLNATARQRVSNLASQIQDGSRQRDNCGEGTVL